MTIWREIGDKLKDEIENGTLAEGGRLAPDAELATRFGVHRHTVRRALAQLQSEGLVRSERGRGTFVVDDAIAYRLGSRTRFEENLLENSRIPGRRILSVSEYNAPEEVSRALQIRRGENVLVVTLLGEANRVPVHVFKAYLPVQRLHGVADAFRSVAEKEAEEISLPKILKSVGIVDFRRRNFRIRCRMPTLEEARHLKMAVTEPVFETESVNLDKEDVPIFFAVTVMCGSRIEFFTDY